MKIFKKKIKSLARKVNRLIHLNLKLSLLKSKLCKIPQNFYDKEYYEPLSNSKKTQYYPLKNKRVRKDHKLRAQWILKNFNIKSFLEIGCGRGFLLKVLKKHGIDAWGVEYSPYAIKTASKSIQPCIIQADVAELKLARKFDMIFSHDVLEHLNVKQITKFLKKSNKIASKSMVHIISCSCDRNIGDARYIRGIDKSHISMYLPYWWKNKMKKYIKEWTLHLYFPKDHFLILDGEKFASVIFVLSKKRFNLKNNKNLDFLC